MGDLQRKPLHIERFPFTARPSKAPQFCPRLATLDAAFVKFLPNPLFVIGTLPSNRRIITLPRSSIIHQGFSGQPSGLLRDNMCNGHSSQCRTGLKHPASIGAFSWRYNRFGCVMDERVTVCPPLTGGFQLQVNQSTITTRSGMNDAAYSCACRLACAH